LHISLAFVALATFAYFLHISLAFVNLWSSSGATALMEQSPGGHMFATAQVVTGRHLVVAYPNFSPLLLFFETKAFKYAKFYRLLFTIPKPQNIAP
jgi:hypothetical protein